MGQKVSFCDKNSPSSGGMVKSCFQKSSSSGGLLQIWQLVVNSYLSIYVCPQATVKQLKFQHLSNILIILDISWCLKCLKLIATKTNVPCSLVAEIWFMSTPVRQTELKLFKVVLLVQTWENAQALPSANFEGIVAILEIFRNFGNFS